MAEQLTVPNKIRECFSCAICATEGLDENWRCSNKLHLYCGSCKARLERCELCRDDNVKICLEDTLLREISCYIPFRCGNARCDVETLLSRRKRHHLYCAFKDDFLCPVCHTCADNLYEMHDHISDHALPTYFAKPSTIFTLCDPRDCDVDVKKTHALVSRQRMVQFLDMYDSVVVFCSALENGGIGISAIYTGSLFGAERTQIRMSVSSAFVMKSITFTAPDACNKKVDLLSEEISLHLRPVELDDFLTNGKIAVTVEVMRRDIIDDAEVDAPPAKRAVSRGYSAAHDDEIEAILSGIDPLATAPASPAEHEELSAAEMGESVGEITVESTVQADEQELGNLSEAPLAEDTMEEESTGQLVPETCLEPVLTAAEPGLPIITADEISAVLEDVERIQSSGSSSRWSEIATYFATTGWEVMADDGIILARWGVTERQ